MLKHSSVDGRAAKRSLKVYYCPGSPCFQVAADPLVGTPGMGPRNYDACGKTAYWGQPDLIADRTLNVRGFVIEPIEQREAAITMGIIPASWLELVDWQDPSEDLPEDFWRTLVADRASGGQSPPPPYFKRACKWAFSLRIPMQALNTREVLTHGDSNPIAREFLRRVQAVVWERRLILSKNHNDQQLVGLVPKEAQKCDLICVLYGCSVPVILRKKDLTEKPGPGKRKRLSRATTDRKKKTQKTSTTKTPAAATREQDAMNTRRSGSRGSSAGGAADLDAGNEAVNNKVELGLANVRDEVGVPNISVPDEYLSIGECYIHGMMSGEGFKHQRATGNKVQAFTLV